MGNRTWLPARTNREKYQAAAAVPDVLLRVLSRVTHEGDCWIWTGARNDRGYGVATVGKQLVYVHRLVNWVVRGPIDDGLVVDHLCRTPLCVNPLHTQAVPPVVNTRRGEGNGSQTECPSGHPYNAENTRYHTDKRGYTRRTCIACTNARNAARAASKAA